jgi:hypothetical protein
VSQVDATTPSILKPVSELEITAGSEVTAGDDLFEVPISYHKHAATYRYISTIMIANATHV